MLCHVNTIGPTDPLPPDSGATLSPVPHTKQVVCGCTPLPRSPLGCRAFPHGPGSRCVHAVNPSRLQSQAGKRRARKPCLSILQCTPSCPSFPFNSSKQRGRACSRACRTVLHLARASRDPPPRLARSRHRSCTHSKTNIRLSHCPTQVLPFLPFPSSGVAHSGAACGWRGRMRRRAEDAPLQRARSSYVFSVREKVTFSSLRFSETSGSFSSIPEHSPIQRTGRTS